MASVTKKPRLCGRNSFVKAWLKEKQFKPWLQQSSDGSALCRFCNCKLRPKKDGLGEHMKTEKHIAALKAFSNCDAVRPLTSIGGFSHVIIPNQGLKEIELLIAAFIAEHSSINTVDHLAELIKTRIAPKDQNASKIKLHRTKCGALIVNVLAPTLRDELLADVRNGKFFSLIIDESTDVGTQKALGIMIRYFSMKLRSVVTTFYRLILLESCKAEDITNVLIKALEIDSLGIENLIGIGVDNANVMVGAFNSLFARLQSYQPNIIMIRCICHSLALAANCAVAKLPSDLDGIIEMTYTWFSHSSKRKGRYEEIYSLLNDGNCPKKILRFCSTRWLSRYECINRILEQWDILKMYFSSISNEEQSFTVDKLITLYTEKNKAYLIFLADKLKEICNVNKLFQSANVNPLALVERLTLVYFGLLQKLITRGRYGQVNVNNIESFAFETFLEAPDQMEFPPAFYNHVLAVKLSAQDISEIRILCRSFLLELCKQMKQRLPSSVAGLEKLRLFEPKKVLTPVHASDNHLRLLLKTLPAVGDVEMAITEYNLLYKKKDEWSSAKDNNPVLFWSEVLADDESNDESCRRFANITNFALAALSLPFSNASVERAFSIMALVKTKLRNRMYLKTVDAIMAVRFLLQWRNETCVSFSITKAMLDKFNLSMYDFEKTQQNDVSIISDEETENEVNGEALQMVGSAFEEIDGNVVVSCISL